MNADVAYCKKLNKFHGKSYYFATQFFPREIRDATYVLYAFFRVPDEIVDTQSGKPSAQVAHEIEQWREQWRLTIANKGQSVEPVLRATYYIFEQYHIPFGYGEDFLSAMIQDVTVDRYANYEALKKYMYGSAAVVGRILSYVVGFSDAKAMTFADDLGYAMQLTNFLRDIDEDYRVRQRIYVPLDELAQFGLSEHTIIQREYNDQWVRFMQFQIDRARALYHVAEEGIALLHPRGQRAVRIASRVYRDILREIEKRHGNIFLGRVHTSTFDKIIQVCGSFVTKI